MKDPLPIRFTKAQLLLSKWIRESGFSNSLEKEFPPYFVDIFIGELNLGIEVDSRFHISKKKDIQRDLFIREKYNVPILHIDNKSIIPINKEKIIHSILAHPEIC